MSFNGNIEKLKFFNKIIRCIFYIFCYANYQQEIQQQQAVVSSSQLGNQNSGAIPPPHSQSPSHPYRSINEKK